VLPELSDEFSPPSWWSDLDGDRPVILINQGTVASSLEDLIKPAIEALKDEDALVVAVPLAREFLSSVPENLRVESFVPFDALLPHVDVMVTNGGYGGTQFALAHGVPIVVAGATEDKMEVAALVEWSGAGINLRQKRPSPSSIKKAVKEVFSNPTYRVNAKRIKTDFAKYDAPQRSAELLEKLAEKKGKLTEA
jgi:UDP:flavonoid glycosyltransferase YjiC (YdhE family)